jgi:hypothetical protein
MLCMRAEHISLRVPSDLLAKLRAEAVLSERSLTWIVVRHLSYSFRQDAKAEMAQTAEREQSRRSRKRNLAPPPKTAEAFPGPPSATAIAAAIPGVVTGASLPARPAHAATCRCAMCRA